MFKKLVYHSICPNTGKLEIIQQYPTVREKVCKWCCSYYIVFIRFKNEMKTDWSNGDNCRSGVIGT